MLSAWVILSFRNTEAQVPCGSWVVRAAGDKWARRGGHALPPAELPFVVTMGDVELVFRGETLHGEAHAVPCPVVAKE